MTFLKWARQDKEVILENRVSFILQGARFLQIDWRGYAKEDCYKVIEYYKKRLINNRLESKNYVRNRTMHDKGTIELWQTKAW